MFTQKQPDEKSKLEEAIDDLFDELKSVDGESKEYASMASQMVKLYELKSIDARPSVSPDTKLLVLANLAGIAIIVGFEKSHILTSKAINFVSKLR